MWTHVQGWAKEWTLGCVNPASWLSLAAGGEFMQPRDHSFAQPCSLYGKLKCQNTNLGGGESIITYYEGQEYSKIKGYCFSLVPAAQHCGARPLDPKPKPSTNQPPPPPERNLQIRQRSRQQQRSFNGTKVSCRTPRL